MNIIKTYWKTANGNPYAGGRFGYDSVTEMDGEVISRSTYRPAGAVDILVGEYDTLVEAFRVEWDARAIGGKEYVDASVAARDALRNSGRIKLTTGTPLTNAEATAIAGP